jgi:hypothetical protein
MRLLLGEGLGAALLLRLLLEHAYEGVVQRKMVGIKAVRCVAMEPFFSHFPHEDAIHSLPVLLEGLRT